MKKSYRLLSFILALCLVASLGLAVTAYAGNFDVTGSDDDYEHTSTPDPTPTTQLQH